MNGQGVALGRHPLVKDLIEFGALVAPFNSTLVGSRAYISSFYCPLRRASRTCGSLLTGLFVRPSAS